MSNLPSLENDIRNRLAALGVNATDNQKELMEILAEALPSGKPDEVGIKDKLWADYQTDRDKQEAIEFFKRLDKTGCGTYTVGRHGKASRIIWKFDVQQIARAFLGLDGPANTVSDDLPESRALLAGDQDATDSDLNQSAPQREWRVAERHTAEHSYFEVNKASHRGENERSSSLITDASNVEFYDHSFLLRAGLKITVSLPLNITKDEANRLAEFIRSVPF